MKLSRIAVILLLCLGLMACGGSQPEETSPVLTLDPVASATYLAEEGGVTVSFDYEKQSGYASNQYAIWVEDESGNHVRTLFATNFTAGGGWEKREQSIPDWVQAFNIKDADKQQVDAISGATPAAGYQTYIWDCTGSDGSPMPDGSYTIILEATLREEKRVLYKSQIELGSDASTASPEPEYIGDECEERGMISNVVVVYKP